MDKKEIHNLSEAYLEVYEQSIVDRAKNAVGHQRAGTHGDDDEINQNQGAITKNLKKLRPYGEKGFPSVKKEEVDIYNNVLSYLLDEGYAETEKAAEAIVENMSEEWINFVVETKLGYAAQKIANIARSKGDTKKEMQARKLATRQFSSAADPAKHGKANVNRARQQAKQRQERQPEDRYDDHPSLSARERNPNLR